MDERQLQHVWEFKFFRILLDESGTDETECRRKVGSGGESCESNQISGECYAFAT